MPRLHKTNRSLLKRVKVTGTKKLTKRRAHQNHFNVKESGNATRRKRGSKDVPTELQKKMKALLPALS